MKATLEYTLPKDDTDFYNAVNGSKLNCILWNYNLWLNEKIKLNNSKDLQDCKDKLLSLFLEQNIELE